MSPEAISGAVRSLAALLAGAFGELPSLPAPDEALVRLALVRHQVGPLLFMALASAPDRMAPELWEKLAEGYRQNARRQKDAVARLRRIGAVFDAHGIAWMSLKGAPQAERLYGDAALRHSSDIDLLVPPRDFRRAVEALMEAGYIPSNPPVPFRPLRGLVLAAVRDISLIAADDRTCAVDLHRRLFLAPCRCAQTIRFRSAPGAVPQPTPDAGLACYLLLHGAQSWWVRLKWLVDLVPLLVMLDEAEKRRIRVLARETGTEKSVVASLLLLRDLFPFAKLGPLAPWIDAESGRSAIRKRLARYRRMISLDSDWKHSPLDNARLTMQAYLALFESPWTRFRMVPVALLSSAVRRVAGAVWREERALTQCDAPDAPGLPSR